MANNSNLKYLDENGLLYFWQKIKNKFVAKETLTNIQDQLLDIFYPIGSYYETSDTSFDPNVTWGGTWVKDSKGRVTVALDDSDADFNTSSKTGGEKTHTLTVFEMPSHNHGIQTWHDSGATNGVQAYDARNKGGTAYTNSAGGNQPHNNLQPYIVVVRWHRTA